MDRVCIPVETEKGPAFVFAYPFDIQTTDRLSHDSSSGKEFYVGSENAIRYHLEHVLLREKIKEVDHKTILPKRAIS